MEKQNPKNQAIRFEVLHLPPENTNSVLVSGGDKAVIFDAWGRADDWAQLLSGRGLQLVAIYSTHGHPDHISAAPDLARKFNVDWFLHKNDNYLVGNANEFLDMFGLQHITGDYIRPRNMPFGTIEILPGVKMEIQESPGHTPGGVMFYFPQYKILLIGDTLFQDCVGRYDLPGGNQKDLLESVRKLYNKNLDDKTTVIHGHGMETNIGWLKQNNPWFIGR